MRLQQIPVAQRFWQKVDRSGDCWLWTGAKRTNMHGISYGAIWVGGGSGGHVPAHRVSFEMANGPIPDGLFILHKCDNGLCVRPDHLFAGTHIDNMHDMATKNRAAKGVRHGKYTKPHRTARGENNGNSKLKSNDAKTIRERYANGGISMAMLAREFSVSKKTILNIIHGKIWA